MNFTNIVESSRSKDGRGREDGNINFRGRGRGSFRGRGRCSFNQQWRDNNFRPSNQGRGGHNDRSTNHGRGRGNFTYQERTNFNCYHCGKFGHKATDCRFKQHANIAEHQYQHTGESFDNPQTLLLIANNFLGDGDIWYLDIGCSNHMCGKKELFSSLDG